VIAAVALGVLPLAACSQDPRVEDATVTPPAIGDAEQPRVGEEGEGGAAQQSLHLHLRLGERVELTGEVAEVLAPHAFTVGGDEIGENPILVVGADLFPDLADGDTVRISGTVIEFSVPGYEQDLELDLVDQEFEDFNGNPTIQADSVTHS
jgi:hypothetical protein